MIRGSKFVFINFRFAWNYISVVTLIAIIILSVIRVSEGFTLTA